MHVHPPRRVGAVLLEVAQIWAHRASGRLDVGMTSGRRHQLLFSGGGLVRLGDYMLLNAATRAGWCSFTPTPSTGTSDWRSLGRFLFQKVLAPTPGLPARLGSGARVHWASPAPDLGGFIEPELAAALAGDPAPWDLLLSELGADAQEQLLALHHLHLVHLVLEDCALDEDIGQGILPAELTDALEDPLWLAGALRAAAGPLHPPNPPQPRTAEGTG